MAGVVVRETGADVADPSEIELPATSWAVLGVLSFDEELSGYDVKRWADQSLAFFYWAPSHSQIYAELRRLESLGLATSRIEQTHEARSRRLYAITPLGHRFMQHWADEQEPEPVVLKHSVMLRLWAAHAGDPTRLREVLTDYRDEARERSRRAGAHSEGAATVPNWAFPSLALEWASRFYADEAERIDWILGRLDSLAPSAEVS